MRPHTKPSPRQQAAKRRQQGVERKRAQRQASADTLNGIWAGLPKHIQRELQQKTYCPCGHDNCPDCNPST